MGLFLAFHFRLSSVLGASATLGIYGHKFLPIDGIVQHSLTVLFGRDFDGGEDHLGPFGLRVLDFVDGFHLGEGALLEIEMGDGCLFGDGVPFD